MKQLIENAFKESYGRIYMTEDAVIDLLGISNEELKNFINKVKFKNYSYYGDIVNIDGKDCYTSNIILIVKKFSKNKSNFTEKELNKIFEDEQNKFFRCFENGKKYNKNIKSNENVNENIDNSGIVFGLLTIFVMTFIFSCMFCGNSDNNKYTISNKSEISSEVKQQLKNNTKENEEKINESEKIKNMINEEKSEYELAELQKKYDNQKKYEEYIAWQKQLEEQKKLEEEQNLTQSTSNYSNSKTYYVNDWINRMKNLVDEEENQWYSTMEYKTSSSVKNMYDRLKGYKSRIPSIPSNIPYEINIDMNEAVKNFNLVIDSRLNILDSIYGVAISGNSFYGDMDLAEITRYVYEDTKNEIDQVYNIIYKIQYKASNIEYFTDEIPDKYLDDDGIIYTKVIR